MQILAVVGAATPPGRLAGAIERLGEDLDNSDVDLEIVNLAEARLEICDGRPTDDYDPVTRRVVEQFGEAQAVLLASPVYRAGVPGVLKNLLDLVPVEALIAKPVGIVAMGGSDHHYLGVDRDLRGVMAWFGALTAPTSVYMTPRSFADGVIEQAPLEELLELVETLVRLAPVAGDVGPKPLAARVWT